MALYILKLNVTLVLLYGFYKSVLGRDTFFGWRRAALMGAYLLSVLIPLLNLANWLEGSSAAVAVAQNYAAIMLPTVEVNAGASAWGWRDVLFGLYLCVTALLLLRFGWQIAAICRLNRQAARQVIGGITVRVIGGQGSPFSFFGWIFLNPEALTDSELADVLVHERVHAAQVHSADVLVAELFSIFCWFNPFAWMLKKEVKINLEYLADERVVAVGNARKAYQYHLLGLACRPCVQAPQQTELHYGGVVNNFYVLSLKQRIMMMNKKRTHEWMKTKYLLALPVAAGLLLVSNIEMVARSLGTSAAEPVTATATSAAVQPAVPMALSGSPVITIRTVVPVPQKKQTAKAGPSGKVFEVVEVMPQYPGGTEAMMKYLAANLKYPKKAEDKNIQGRVVVSFIVEADGSISNVHTLRSISPELDAEALRVVKAMPKWKPGKQKGKTVRVKYALPVQFKMTEDKAKKKPTGNVAYIVDGKPEADISSLNPADIEHVEVMKDAESLRKYNAEGKEGVVIVTTRKTN